jgi:hypothetical protein
LRNEDALFVVRMKMPHMYYSIKILGNEEVEEKKNF